MRQYTDNFLDLVVTFLDLCQTQAVNGRIDTKLYRELTKVKIDFIKNILGSQKKKLVDDELISKLERICCTDQFIYSQYRSLAESRLS